MARERWPARTAAGRGDPVAIGTFKVAADGHAAGSYLPCLQRGCASACTGPALATGCGPSRFVVT